MGLYGYRPALSDKTIDRLRAYIADKEQCELYTGTGHNPAMSYKIEEVIDQLLTEAGY